MSESWDDGNDLPRDHQRRAHGSSGTKWIVIALAGAGIVAMIVCCGGGALLLQFGSGVLEEEVKNELKANPVIREKIGVVRELDIDWIRSGAAEGDDEFVFRISGDNGSGYVTVESVTNDAGVEEVRSGTLEMDSGETRDLFPDEAAD